MSENAETPWWAKLEGLPMMVTQLAVARKDAAKSAELVRQAEVLVENSVEGRMLADAKDRLAADRLQVEMADAGARKQAEDDFRANGDKSLLPGVSVKLFTKYQYDPVEVTTWARTNMPALLVLDGKRVEKAAAAGILTDAPVTVTKEPRVQLATDLSQYLKEPA